MAYPFGEIEKKWQSYWEEKKTFRAEIDPKRPKCYILDMFPYPSGSGLHVGHPLGYIASDIYSRYKRHQGFNVLHPMGFDAFGLPAEQYAIETGQHPAKTTRENVARYKEQLSSIGFSFDWSRELSTADPDFYRWTQWIFLKLFNSWYNPESQKAEPISDLLSKLEAEGGEGFTADDWSAFNETEREQRLMDYRLAYLAHAMVNWCPALGTVLANDEVKEGVSIRGDHPVVRKSMRQWFLRITAYADRLLSALDDLDWTDSMKEMQRNWIGRSEGAAMYFEVEGTKEQINFFTTRPDTSFGASFMVLAPEHEMTASLTTGEQKDEVEKYVDYVKSRTERERLVEVDKISGAFTGSYAINPFTEKKIPIWISEYVLMGYGTGAIMAVPAHDARDHAFAKHFSLPIVEVVKGPRGHDVQAESHDAKQGKLINSGFLDGMEVPEAIRSIIKKVIESGQGSEQINFKLRDAAFSRQRYWGEPFPIYYKDDLPFALGEDKLPVELPEIDSYQPTEDGTSPLGRAKDWTSANGDPLETDTMPGYAGSSWYFFRYMDPNNKEEFVSKETQSYWENVDLYLGGAEHATGHLLYARFWTQFLYDLGYVSVKEPFKRLINQGMILGENMEKMSKSKDNVVNPDEVIADYGADTFRIYEMFLGPIEQHKPWDTKGIDGSFRFLNRFYRMYMNENGGSLINEDSPTEEELKVLHKTIQKVSEDIERFSFNTAISAFMICVNELMALKCHKREVLEPLLILISPFAPHLAEELWALMGNESSISIAAFPTYDEQYVSEDSFEYPVAINGKKRTKISFGLDQPVEDIEKAVVENEAVLKWLEGKPPKKIIVVRGRMINVVV